LCEESPKDDIILLVNGDEKYHHEIINLKSYKLYNISIALMSHIRLGIPKGPITVRTLESGGFGEVYQLKVFPIDLFIYFINSSNSAEKYQSY
jgi:hypothetical protein